MVPQYMEKQWVQLLPAFGKEIKMFYNIFYFSSAEKGWDTQCCFFSQFLEIYIRDRKWIKSVIESDVPVLFHGRKNNREIESYWNIIPPTY